MPRLSSELSERLSSVEIEPVVRRFSEGEEKAFAKVQRLCAVRERCVAELERRLVRDGFSESEAAVALERAVACGLVDDLRYAGVLVRSRVAQGRGREGIRHELESAGIDPADIPGWPEAFFDGDSESELERALELLRRKPPRAKDVRAAAFRRLVGKGYGREASYEAARIYAAEINSESNEGSFF